MNNGRDCEHGRRVVSCDSCDLVQAENTIARLLAGKWDGTELALISSTQVIAEIRAEAVEKFSSALASRVEVPDASPAKIEYYKAAIRHVLQFASGYAAKVRQGEQGTWLKDSNVNGGKRQGGDQ